MGQGYVGQVWGMVMCFGYGCRVMWVGYGAGL